MRLNDDHNEGTTVESTDAPDGREGSSSTPPETAASARDIPPELTWEKGLFGQRVRARRSTEGRPSATALDPERRAPLAHGSCLPADSDPSWLKLTSSADDHTPTRAARKGLAEYPPGTLDPRGRVPLTDMSACDKCRGPLSESERSRWRSLNMLWALCARCEAEPE
ncbi:hypothetical protein acdb102_16020 [Acidothermaceae bacterium B102]|nr:hypothetical protein acdb102_16020 [Acidothermaceae bacterium B102]